MRSNWRNALTPARIGISAMAGVLGGILLTMAAVGTFMLHGDQVTLNYYTNGTADLSMDATILIKSFYVLLTAIFGMGVALGLLIAQREQKR